MLDGWLVAFGLIVATVMFGMAVVLGDRMPKPLHQDQPRRGCPACGDTRIWVQFLPPELSPTGRFEDTGDLECVACGHRWRGRMVRTA